jgi:hypothetical protein
LPKSDEEEEKFEEKKISKKEEYINTFTFNEDKLDHLKPEGHKDMFF